MASSGADISCVLFLRTPGWRFFVDAEHSSRLLQVMIDVFCRRVRGTEHAPPDPFRVLERRHGLADIVERGGRVPVERPRVIPTHLKDEIVARAANTSRHWYRFAEQCFDFFEAQ